MREAAPGRTAREGTRPGRRLGQSAAPITHTSAKQLVPVANKPILFYGLEQIRDAGVTEVGIIVGDTGPEIRAAVGDGSAFGLTITYIPQDAPLGWPTRC